MIRWLQTQKSQDKGAQVRDNATLLSPMFSGF
jgi:hypothetical protein